MRDANFAANSQVLRELLHEITIDTSIPPVRQRDHNAVLSELAKRLKERYGIKVHSFNLQPRDTTYITLEALGSDMEHGRIIASHFANTLFIAKRKHYATWSVNP